MNYHARLSRFFNSALERRGTVYVSKPFPPYQDSRLIHNARRDHGFSCIAYSSSLSSLSLEKSWYPSSTPNVTEGAKVRPLSVSSCSTPAIASMLSSPNKSASTCATPTQISELALLERGGTAPECTYTLHMHLHPGC